MKGSFWKDKRVFLTGHTGFKGAWLSLWLEKLGAKVTGFSLAPPSSPSLFEEASVNQGMISVQGDVRDFEALRSAVEKCDPEIAIHMAAQSLVRYGYAEPLETYSTNVMGTVNFLEALRNSKALRAAIVVTSDKCYAEDEERRRRGYKEGDPLGGPDPYSSSKACAEETVSAYRNAYYSSISDRVGLASVRAGNVIGGGDWAEDRLIPDLIQGFISKQPTSIRLPDAKRPWQHVLDPLRGYLELAEKLWENPQSFSEAWNFGPGEEHHKTVRWIADETVKNWGSDAQWKLEGVPQQLAEADILRLDSSKTKENLGWAPLLTLEAALQWIVEWHKCRELGDDMRLTTMQDIGRYEELSEMK